MTNRAMVRLVLAVVILVGGGLAQADLRGSIRRALDDKLLSQATVGIQVVALGEQPADDRILYEQHGATPLVPASNMKLLTTSAAIELLGADFRFRTLLVKRGDDLILVGDGDPTFGDAELLKKVGWESTTVFQNWAQELKKAAMLRFRNVLVDDSVFDAVFLHNDWPQEQQQSRYMPQIGGMAFNANCIDFYIQPMGAGRVVGYRTDPPTRYVSVNNSCTGGGKNAVWLTRYVGGNQIILRGTCPAASEAPVSVTIHDPGLYAATVLAETFAAAGIAMEGQVARDLSVRPDLMRGKAAGTYTLLAVHETPLSVVLARANKDSMNLYAESLCKRIGHAVSGQSGSWESGTAAIAGFLKKIGVDESEFRLADGSGLARSNQISARALLRVLSHRFHGPQRTMFMNSLAVGGEDGTLDRRFRQSELRGRVLAKSGYISKVSALSGYLKGRDERWYAFSILMNDLPAGSNWKAKQIQEAIVEAIDDAIRSAG